MSIICATRRLCLLFILFNLLRYIYEVIEFTKSPGSWLESMLFLCSLTVLFGGFLHTFKPKCTNENVDYPSVSTLSLETSVYILCFYVASLHFLLLWPEGSPRMGSCMMSALLWTVSGFGYYRLFYEPDGTSKPAWTDYLG